MIYTDNPIRDAEIYFEQLEQAAAQMPQCDICGKPVDDHYYDINGEIVCEDCLWENFRKDVEI